MKCEIIKDLLPSYIDGLTSNESNSEIRQHLKDCQLCNEVLEQMKTEISTENIEVNKEKIKPFKKLNKRVLQSVLITLASCLLIVGLYFYFFGIGWSVNSDDLKITYSYDNNVILFNFELTDGRVLNSWTNYERPYPVIKFTECFSSLLDDRGEHPNKFSYGIHYIDENGGQRTFADDDCIILHFKDKTETLYFKKIAKELGLQ